MKNRLKERKKRLFLLSFVMFSFIGVIFSVYRFTSIFAINEVAVEGVSQEEVLLIKNSIEKHKHGTHYLFLTNNSIFTPNESAIKEIVTNAIPSAKKIEISIKGTNRIVVSVEEHVPVFRLATTTFLTKEGILFESKKLYPTMPTLFLFASSTRHDVVEGVPYVFLTSLSLETLYSIIDFAEKISTVLFPVHTIIIDEHNDIIFSEDGGGVVKSMIQNLTQKSWTTFISAIDTEPLKSKISKEKDSLQYIDIRFGNKVFYSFSDETFLGTSSAGILHNNHEEISITTSTTTE
jgi:hypothetical protein